MGWSGGQYSLYRAGLACAVAGAIASSSAAIARGAGRFELDFASNPLAASTAFGLFGAGVLLSIGLALGRRDRLAARLLAPGVLLAEVAAQSGDHVPAILDALAGRTALLLALLLLLHARTPAAPFGSIEARERTDPRGGWMRPPEQTQIAWTLLALVFAARTLQALPLGGFAHSAALTSRIGGRTIFSAGAEHGALLAAGFVLVGSLIGLARPAARATCWSVLALFTWAWLVATGALTREGPLVLLLACASEPAWWPGRSLERAGEPVRNAVNAAQGLPARLFYDGDCGFCHRSVRFVLAEELATPAALRLRFAPLASETFRTRMVAHPEQDPARLPDSIVLETEAGRLLTRSRAALEIASRLGGFWRLLALAARLVPSPILDAAYDAIARVRKRLFATPKDACPLLPPDLRARFDP